MTDLERDLRDMMNQTAGGVQHVPRPSRGLVRRARLRQARTAALAGAAVVALVIGGFAGAGSLTSDRAIPPANPDSHGTFADVHGWIAYRSGSEIVAVDPANPSDTVSLGPSHRLDPIAWSRDGSRLLLRYGQETEDLYVLNADGSRIRLTTGGTSYSGSFSPDGQMIVYQEVIAREGGFAADSGLYVITATGGEPQRLVAAGGQTRLSDPAWSPDGSRIAFIEGEIVGETRGVEPVYQLSLSVVNSDGTGQRVLRDLGREDRSPTGGAGELVWSPDGSRLAFSSHSPNAPRESHIYVVNADGSKLRRLTDEGINSTPVWSPDGSHVAFVHERRPLDVDRPTYLLSTMASDGTDLQLVNGVMPDGAIAWNPVP